MKRVARVVAILAAASFAACFSKPGAPHALDDAKTNDGRTSDGTMIDPDARPDSPPGTCGIAVDNYQSTTASHPCGNWASGPIVAGVTLTRTGQVLSASVGAGKSFACTSTNAFDATHGTSVEVVTGGLSLYSLNWSFPTTNGDASITMTGGGTSYMVHLNCFNHPTTTPLAVMVPAFLRMTASPSVAGSVTINAYTSSTNGNWGNPFDSCIITAASSATATGGFSGSGSAATTVAGQFDEYNTYDCPPPP